MSIRLRHLKKEDAQYMLEWMKDADITQYLDGSFENISLDDCEKFILSSAFRISRQDFAIADEMDTYRGTVSLKNIDDEDMTAELSIVLRSCAIGSGYAIEAIRQLKRIAFSGIGLKKIFINVDRRNMRAIRFYEKIGAERIKDEGDIICLLIKNDL